jgi:TRAP-type C4-dicarboxylate transport system permease small subunit
MSKKTPPNAKISFGRWCLRNPTEFFALNLISILCAVVFWQVFARYALRAPVAWGEEFAMFLFQWVSFIGAAIATRQSAHYGLDILTKRLSPRGKTRAHFVGSFLIFFVAYIMIEKGIGMMQITWYQDFPVMRFSVAYAYAAIVVGGILMMIFQIPIFWEQMRKLRGR